MDSFTSMGEAMLAAHAGQRQIAVALAAEARRVMRDLLTWLRRSLPSAQAE